MQTNFLCRLFATIILGVFFTACNDDVVKEETVIVKDTASEVASPLRTELSDEDRYNGEQMSKKYLVYEMDFDNETLDRNAEFNSANLQVDSIIKGLNYRFRDVPIKKIKLGNDTLYAKISDSKYLTAQMGSTGAAAYIAEVVVNITSVNGINFVNLDFKQGDHASPGVYAKSDYQNFQVLK